MSKLHLALYSPDSSRTLVKLMLLRFREINVLSSPLFSLTKTRVGGDLYVWAWLAGPSGGTPTGRTTTGLMDSCRLWPSAIRLSWKGGRFMLSVALRCLECLRDRLLSESIVRSGELKTDGVEMFLLSE